MDERPHTPGKIRIEDRGGDRYIYSCDTGESLACDMQYYPWTFGRDDAERVVATWNACEGMADPQATITALVGALKSVVVFFDAIESEQWERTGPTQTLESASRNWELPSAVPPLDMAPIRAALALVPPAAKVTP